MPEYGERQLETVVDAEHTGMRLDKYLADALDLFARSQIQHRNVRVTVKGSPVKLSTRLHEGDHLSVRYSQPQPLTLEPESIPLDLLYEDADVVVINKAAGMVVHPGAGNWHGTLVQALLGHIQGLRSAFPDGVRPGIVHRLDRETTGVIIAAKHPAASNFLAAQFKMRSTEKTYLAFVRGQLSNGSGMIDRPIARDPRHRKRFSVVSDGGKPAVTRYRVLWQDRDFSIVELHPKSGRTHQLRVHMAALGHPIVGDTLYGRAGGRFPHAPLMLHAGRLEIDLPSGGRRAFIAPLPDSFTSVWPASLANPLETS